MVHAVMAHRQTQVDRSLGIGLAQGLIGAQHPPRQMRQTKSYQDLKYSMWALNTFFFCAIFMCIHTGDLWAMIPISGIYMLLLNWLAELEDNGTIDNTERPGSYDNYHSNRLCNDKSSDLDNTEAR